MIASDDDVEPVNIQCTYRSWARVRVVASAQGPHGRLPPTVDLCAFSFGLERSAEDVFEDETWATHCAFYEGLEGKGNVVPCSWRFGWWSGRPRVAFAKELIQWRINEVLLLLPLTLFCFVCCCCFIGCAFKVCG